MRNIKKETAISTQDCGSKTNLVNTPNKTKQKENGFVMSQYTPKQNKIQFNLNSFVCDECCAPLRLYGQNFFDAYARGKCSLLRCLCDLCSAEMEVNS
jgi:hypothetical protein